MTTRYTIIQFVPDPAAGERVNVGLLAWNSTEVKLNFIADYTRAKLLARPQQGTLNALEQIRDQLLEVCDTCKGDGADAYLQTLVKESQNIIQFSQISATLATPSEAVAQLSPLFLKEHQRRPRTNRGRQKAVSLFANKAEEVAFEVWQDLDVVEHALHLRQHVQGSLTEHSTAFSIQNGSLRVLGLADSMEADPSENTKGKLLFDAQDLRQLYAQLPMACLLFPPTQANETSEALYRDTVGLLNRLKITPLDEGNYQDWLADTFKMIPAEQLRTA